MEPPDPAVSEPFRRLSRGTGPSRRALAGVIAVLAIWNPVSNLVLPDAWYVPANVAAGCVLVVIAARGGADPDDLGLRRDQAHSGWRWGLPVAAAAAVVVAAAAAVPATRSLFEDERFAGVSLGGALYQVLFRIPVGTALFEEIAFRGVLFGMAARHASMRAAAAGSSVLFGLWHIVPTLAALETNTLGDARGLPATTGLVVGAIVATTVAGLGFVWLRLRARSLVAPVVVHAAINATAYAVGWALVSG